MLMLSNADAMQCNSNANQFWFKAMLLCVMMILKTNFEKDGGEGGGCQK